MTDVPADSGHLWRVSITEVLGASKVVGEPHFSDHPALEPVRTLAALIRGHSLSDAFTNASKLTLVEWLVRDEHGRFCGMVDADGSVAPTPEGKCGYCGPTCQHCLLTDGRLPIYGLNADGVWACHADSDLMDQS
jgi:hypothetical protein